MAGSLWRALVFPKDMEWGLQMSFYKSKVISDFTNNAGGTDSIILQININLSLPLY